MPLRNRVTPLGALVAEPGRGLVYGNRGCLHDPAGTIRRSHATRRWIACRLEFRGWHRGPLQQPGRFTELFFLDEATAFAAGHRPCALCRHTDYSRVRALWEQLHGGPAGADAIDARLHGERLRPDGSRLLHSRPYADLPDGAFVLHEGVPKLVARGRLHRWSASGYTRPGPLPGGPARVITPPSLLAVLDAGWEPAVPLLHPSATSGST